MKVLIIQVRQLGDVLLSSPLAKAVKEETGAEVHFLTSLAGKEILKGNPFIDKVITVEEGAVAEIKALAAVRKEKYDWVIDAQRTGRSKRITLLSGAPKRVAFKRERENFYYNVLVKWKNLGYTVWERLELLKPLGIEVSKRENYLPSFYNYQEVKVPFKEFISIVPTARKREKMWNLKEFARLIEELPLPVYALYAPGEENFIKELKEECKVSFYYPEKPHRIGESAFVIKESSLFIGLNSFASHLAVASRKKTVVVDRKSSGWFPKVPWVREVYGENAFPSSKDVLREAVNLLEG